MMNNATVATVLVLLYAGLGFATNQRKRAKLPRVGRAGPFGYAWTVLRSVLDSDGLVEEGWAKYGGKPFVLPSMSGEWIVLGPDDIEQLRRSDDTVFNAPERAKALFLPNTMFGNHLTDHPYHLETIIRSDLTKSLHSLVPEMHEEAQLAIPDHIPIISGQTSATIPLFSTMVHLIARVSNRAMIGAPGCRDEKFLQYQVSVAEEVIPMSQILNWFPAALRPVVWKLFCVTLGAKDRAVKLIGPYVKARIEIQQDNPSTIVDLLLRYAPEEEIKNLPMLAARVVHLNMAATHTSGIFTTHALFELARLPPEQVEMVRTEIAAAIASEGGVLNKTAVGKFYLLDSLLKEIGRFHSLFAVGSSRVTLKEAVISDGTVLPPGSVVALAPKPMHNNPKTYSDPETFDPFRFTKLRTGAGTAADIQQSFTTLSNDYIVFGIGKHGCPGRFFAALKIKVVLAELLLNYDFSFPEGASHAPKPFSFNIFTVPNPTAKLVFTKRQRF